MKYLFFLFTTFFVSPSITQTPIKMSGAVMYDFYQWGDNYVCNGLAGISAYSGQKVVLYSKSGNLLWEKEVAAEATASKLVVDKKGDYAYLIEMVNRNGTNKKLTDASNVLTIYRFDKSGNVKIINLNYAKNVAILLGSGFDFVNVEYMCANSNGMSAVISKCNEDKWTSRKYALVSITQEGETTISKIDFEGTKDEWYRGTLSIPDFQKIGDTLLMIQMQKDANKLKVNLSRFDLITTAQISSVTNDVTLKSEYMHGKSRDKEILQEGVANLVEHTYVSGNSSTATFEFSTLGASFNCQVANGRVYLLGTFYFGGKSELFTLSADMVGYLYFEVDPTADKIVATEEVNYIPFDETYGKDVYYSVVIENGEAYAACVYKKGLYYFVDGKYKGTLEIEQEGSSNLGVVSALSTIFGGDQKAKEVDDISDIYRDGYNFNIYAQSDLNARMVYHSNIGK